MVLAVRRPTLALTIFPSLKKRIDAWARLCRFALRDLVAARCRVADLRFADLTGTWSRPRMRLSADFNRPMTGLWVALRFRDFFLPILSESFGRRVFGNLRVVAGLSGDFHFLGRCPTFEIGLRACAFARLPGSAAREVLRDRFFETFFGCGGLPFARRTLLCLLRMRAIKVISRLRAALKAHRPGFDDSGGLRESSLSVSCRFPKAFHCLRRNSSLRRYVKQVAKYRSACSRAGV